MFQLCNTKMGMSLIEVVIALAILSIISLFTVSSTSQGFKISHKTTVESDYYHSLRTALRHVERDVTLAYHSFSDTKLGYAYRKQKIADQQINDEYVLESFFIGSKNKMTFTSSSHRRMYKNTKETDTCEVSYYVDRDISSTDLSNLYKRESTFIDDNKKESGNTYILAPNVEAISFRYFTSKSFTKEGKWYDKWDSTEGEFENIFPEAIEVKIVLKHPFIDDRQISVAEQIKILNPNNISAITPTGIVSEENGI